MNTIITRHYPASKLPGDLREDINPSSLVTVTITQRRTSPVEAGAYPDEITELREHANPTKEADVEFRGGPDERDE
jgi:hypothetical protein